MKSRTTMQIERELLEQMKKKKKYPRETYGDQIKRLMSLEEKIRKKRKLQ